MKKKKSKTRARPSAPPAAAETPTPPTVAIVIAADPAWAGDPAFDGCLYALERGVGMAGGSARRFAFPFPADGKGAEAPSLLPHRDLLADAVECLVWETRADGLILAGARNESLTGLLMGAARSNVPAIVSPVFVVGTEAPSSEPYADRAAACLSEVMGLSLPLAATAPAGSAEQRTQAQAAGQRAVELIRQGLSIRRLLMPNAFQNAARFDAALGGSSQALVFLLALAQASGVKLSLETFAEVGRRTPQVGWFPGGKSGVDQLHAAGGVAAVLAALKGQWLPHPTVTGRGIIDLAKAGRVTDSRSLRPRTPFRKEGGLKILKGNLAPAGAVLRSSPDLKLKSPVFAGAARVFDSREAALDGFRRKQVRRGEVVVVRYEGPKGGPGLRPLDGVLRLAEAQGLGTSVAFLTDGMWGGGADSLLAVELATPEAAEGSPLAILKDGDRVELDADAGRLHAFLTDTDQKVRLARWQAPPLRARNGFLARYARSVGSVLEGAVLK